MDKLTITGSSRPSAVFIECKWSNLCLQTHGSPQISCTLPLALWWEATDPGEVEIDGEDGSLLQLLQCQPATLTSPTSLHPPQTHTFTDLSPFLPYVPSSFFVPSHCMSEAPYCWLPGAPVSANTPCFCCRFPEVRRDTVAPSPLGVSGLLMLLSCGNVQLR